MCCCDESYTKIEEERAFFSEGDRVADSNIFFGKDDSRIFLGI